MYIPSQEEFLNKFPDLDINEVDKIQDFFGSRDFFSCLEYLNDYKKDKEFSFENIGNDKNLKQKMIPLFIQYMGINIKYDTGNKYGISNDLGNNKDNLLGYYEFFDDESDSFELEYNNSRIEGSRVRMSKKYKSSYDSREHIGPCVDKFIFKIEIGRASCRERVCMFV